MAASNPFRAKRALFDFLGTAPNRLLLAQYTVDTTRPVSVEYSPNLNAMEDRCVYGGGVRFEHDDQVAEQMGVLIAETVSIGVYVRVATREPAAVPADNDDQAAAIGRALLGLLRSHPTLVGAGTWLGIGRSPGLQPTAGLATTIRSDLDVMTTIGYNMQFGSRISY